MTLKATTDNIAAMAASKLTGALPALDASALTGIVAGPTTGASDPTVSTNPSGAGAVYENTTTGQLFICTSATAGDNLWLNVGTGDGQVAKPFGGLGGGTLNGYVYGGQLGPSPTTNFNTIEKFSFTSDGNATDHGDLTRATLHSAGASSATDGYAMAGQGVPPVPQYNKLIDKFSFASNTTASSHGTLTANRYGLTGFHTSTHGYAAGGYGDGNPKTNVIDKFAFASNTSGIDHGDLMVVSVYRSNNGACSDTHGFMAGGVEGVASNLIEKFPFASNSGSVDSGQDLSLSKSQMSHVSSTTHGYAVGGYASGTYVSKIDKWAFATSNNATNVGDLVVAVHIAAGHSSTTHGYATAGANHLVATAPLQLDNIQKFSLSSDANGTDIGDLPTSRRYATGCHN